VRTRARAHAAHAPPPPRAAAADDSSAAAGAAASTSEPLRVTLRTAEARATLRFDESRSPAAPRAVRIIVSAVAPGSEAAEAGVRAGDRLLALSDPVRASAMWDLNDKASLRFVRDALRLRVASDVTLLLQPGGGEAETAAEAGAGGGAGVGPLQAGASESVTVAEALEAAYARKADAAAVPTASQRCDAVLLRARTVPAPHVCCAASSLLSPAPTHTCCFAHALAHLRIIPAAAPGASSGARTTWRRWGSATTRASSPQSLQLCFRRRSSFWRSRLPTDGS
jgi:hypothetical protein